MFDSMGRSPSYLLKKSSQKRQRNRKQQGDDGALSCWMDYKSIDTVDNLNILPSAGDSDICIRTLIASPTTTEIFINRLRHEILTPFRYSLSSQIQLLETDHSIHDAINRRKLIRDRIVCGYNAVSSLLFTYSNAKVRGICDKENRVPQLIVLVNGSEKDKTHAPFLPSMLQHIPLLAHELEIPLLILPSSIDSMICTSQKLGSLFCASEKHLYVLAFVSKRPIRPSSIGADKSNDGQTEIAMNDDTNLWSDAHVHASINSFVEFIRGKIKTCSDVDPRTTGNLDK